MSGDTLCVQGVIVLTPYGLDIIENCLSCKMRAEHSFCDLPAAALRTFETIKFATAYPKGAVLFVEGQAPRGIFVLCKGRVKLSICSSDGKTLILKIAEAGEVLGLSANVSGTPYELTAETVDECQVNFVKREDFQPSAFVQRSMIASELSPAPKPPSGLWKACRQFRNLTVHTGGSRTDPNKVRIVGYSTPLGRSSRVRP